MDLKLLTTYCSVPSCDSNRFAKKHIFPKNSVLGELWVNAVNHPVLSSLSYQEIRQKRYWICSKHFSPKCIYFTGHKTLSADAVPTLFMPPKDNRNVKVAEDVSIEVAPTNSIETCLEDTMHCELFPSISYTLSPEDKGVRKSSLDAPDVFPVKSQSRIDKKCLFIVEEDAAIDSALLKRLKPAIVDNVRSKGNCLLDISNFDKVPESFASIPTCSGTEFLDNARFAFAKVSSGTPTSVAADSKPLKGPLPVVQARIRRRRDLHKDLREETDVTPKGKRVIIETLRLQKEFSRCKENLWKKKVRNTLQKRCWLVCENFKNLSSTQRSIVQMKLRNKLKGLNGRRFTEDEKNMALAIYKCSPTAYRFLTKLLILPSVSIIERNLGRIELDTGNNSNISQLLKECGANMKDEKEKVVVLMWNETHLKPEVHYDYKKDKIIGFEDFGGQRTGKFANKIVVFMIRGLWSNTKLPISYYFTNGQTPHCDLVYIIQENIKMLQNAGFHVVATVCDSGSSNSKALEYLRTNYIVECRRNKIEPDPNDGIIEFNGCKMCLMHDLVHLCKCFRNFLLSYLLELDFKDADRDPSVQRKLVKWEHYEKAFDIPGS